MKNPDRLFRDAERIKPSPGLWRLIEAQVDLTANSARKDGGAAEDFPSNLAKPLRTETPGQSEPRGRAAWGSSSVDRRASGANLFGRLNFGHPVAALAACLLLAAALTCAGWFFQVWRAGAFATVADVPHGKNTVPNPKDSGAPAVRKDSEAAPVLKDAEAAQLLDPELIAWQADLGEFDEDTEDGTEEILSGG